MALKFRNTLSRSVQEFVPMDPTGKRLGMYCCGPTVYDFAHIGNWRTFVLGDLVRRYLEFKGYDELGPVSANGVWRVEGSKLTFSLAASVRHAGIPDTTNTIVSLTATQLRLRTVGETMVILNRTK